MKFSTVEVSILILSALLQLICLVAPGWLIFKQGDAAAYMGIFFITACTKESECTTQSYLESYKQTGGTRLIADEFFGITRAQVFVTIAFVATCCTFGLHVVKRVRPTAISSMAFVISTSSFMIGSGALMIWQLSKYYSQIHLFQEQHEIDILGFPYCVLLYSLAFLANIAVFVLFVVDVMRSQRRQINQEHELHADPQPDTDCQLLLDTAGDPSHENGHPYDDDPCLLVMETGRSDRE